MPIADLVMNSDISKCPNKPKPQSCNCKPKPQPCDYDYYVCPPPPPKPLDYPPYPPYGYPCVPPTEPAPIKKSSIEAQICKLSKKSATIKKMIENFSEKNKDAIIKIGEVSYNFGSYKVINKGSDGEVTEEDSVYGERILSILTDELAAIKAKLQELSNELDQEDEDTLGVYGTEKTVTFD